MHRSHARGFGREENYGYGYGYGPQGGGYEGESEEPRRMYGGPGDGYYRGSSAEARGERSYGRGGARSPGGGYPYEGSREARGEYGFQGYGSSQWSPQGGQREHGGYTGYGGGRERFEGDDRDQWNSQQGYGSWSSASRGYQGGRGGEQDRGDAYSGGETDSSYQERYGSSGQGARGRDSFSGGAGWQGENDRRRFEVPRHAGGSYGQEGSLGERHFGRSDESWANSYGPWTGQRGQFGGSSRSAGPKGYTRSDDRIREDLSDRLMGGWGIDASDVEIQVQGGEVTLSGTVSDRRQKYHIEELADSILGVKDVTNQLRVKRQAGSGSESDRGESGSQSRGSANSGSDRSSGAAVGSASGQRRSQGSA